MLNGEFELGGEEKRQSEIETEMENLRRARLTLPIKFGILYCYLEKNEEMLNLGVFNLGWKRFLRGSQQ